MTTVVFASEWQCDQCRTYLPWGGTCLRCRDAEEREQLRRFWEDIN